MLINYVSCSYNLWVISTLAPHLVKSAFISMKAQSLTHLVAFYDGVTASVDQGKLWTSSIWISVRPLIWSPTSFLLLNCRVIGLMDGLLDG